MDQWEIDNYQYFTSTSSLATYGVVRFICIGNAKQKHLGCKKVRCQLEAALQTGATKNFDIS